MLLHRCRCSVVLIFGLVISFLSATAFVVGNLSNEQQHQPPQQQKEQQQANEHHSSQQQRSVTIPSTSTLSSSSTMSRDIHDSPNEDTVAADDDDMVDFATNVVDDDDDTNEACETKTISIAFCGNSMLYFNDSPRQLELMITISQSNTKVVQDSCLRGGATLSSLYEHGNGMMTKFKTTPAKFQLHDIFSSSSSILPSFVINPICSSSTTIGDENEATTTTSHRYNDHISHYDVGSHTVEQMIQSRPQWDYIVLNDYTQGPARSASRQETQHALRTKYVPLILPNKDTTTVIVIQTPAYQQENIKDSSDLGNFIEFTDALAEGTKAYAETLQDAGIANVHVAPVGEAYRYLYNTNRALWNKLYSWDHFHPSPYGTYLQICVLYSTIFHTCIPMDTYNDNYWLYSRCMQPVNEDPLPRPSMEEANELRRVACMVTGVKIEHVSETTTGTSVESNNNDDEFNQNDDDDEINGSSGR